MRKTIFTLIFPSLLAPAVAMALDCANPAQFIGHGPDPFIPYVAYPGYVAPGQSLIESIQDGPWESPATWAGNIVPSPNNVVIIKHRVTLNSTVRVADTAVISTGKLTFNSTLDTRLELGTLQVVCGQLEIGTENAPVESNRKAEIVFLDIPINTTRDPGQYNNGLVVIDGKVTIHGAPKMDTFLRLAAEAPAGASMVTLENPTTGWKPGDLLMFHDTRQYTNTTRPDIPEADHTVQSEVIPIASISGDGRSVTLASSLQYAHKGARDGDDVLIFRPWVGNLTRNVNIRSANPNGTRGHMLFMHRSQIDIRYAQMFELGRTKTDPLNNTLFTPSGSPTQIGTNQIGRYSAHFHHVAGPLSTPANGYQFTFQGNSVFSLLETTSFKWGIALHNSHFGLIKDNVVYNWSGAGIVAEDGNETANMVAHNFVNRLTYTGTGEDSRSREDVGHTGAPFWFRGPNNIIRDNVASGGTGGFAIVVGAMANPTTRIPLGPGSDTAEAGQYTMKDMMAIAIREFARNEVAGATIMGSTIWNVGSRNNVTPVNEIEESVIKDFRVWHVSSYVYYNYKTNRVTFDGAVCLGDFQTLRNLTSAAGAFFFSDYVSFNFKIINSNIQGFLNGILIGPVGDQTIENTYMRNYISIIKVPTWMASGAPAPELPPRTVTLKNVRFVPTGTPSRNDWGTQAFIRLTGIPHARATNLIQRDRLFVYNHNGVVGDNFRGFTPEQKFDAIMPKTQVRQDGWIELLASPDEGLTNQQNRDLHGIMTAGEIAPCHDTRTGIIGFVCPMVNDATPPSIPQGLQATVVSDNRINLTWSASNDPESDVAQYNIYRNGVFIRETPSTNFSDTGLREATQYQYEVSAVNLADIESPKSAPASATTLVDNTPPQLMSVFAAGNPNFVNAVFNEPVNEASAESVLNYVINLGVTVQAAVLQADLKTVALTVSGLLENIQYLLTVNNVTDRSLAGNTIASNTQLPFTFDSQSSPGQTPNGGTPSASNPRGGNSIYTINPSRGWNSIEMACEADLASIFNRIGKEVAVVPTYQRHLSWYGRNNEGRACPSGTYIISGCGGKKKVVIVR